jgi:chromosome segregation ATPase
MSRNAPTALASLSEADQDTLIFEDADEFMSRSNAPMEDVQAQVKEAQEELLHLRMRQEEIERQKQQLELIRHKQERFAKGKRDLVEKLSQAVVGIEGELYNTQKLVEELSATYDGFSRHLDILRSLQPEKWQRAHVDEELDRAIAAIQEADSDFAKASRRLSTLRPADSSRAIAKERSMEADSTGLALSDDLKSWARRGLGFTLPLLGMALFVLVLAKLMF